MNVSSSLYDGRIKAHNVLFEFTIGEYLDSVRRIVDKNQYQRKRISPSKGVYSLLRQDIVLGCVIPPVVLALTTIELPSEEFTHEAALRLVRTNTERLLILDGLQRTYTLLELEDDNKLDSAEELRSRKMRVEIYIGIDRLGILYRMLTLNTGQTPMSLRQQIEMLYLDYLDVGLPGIRFVREVSQERATDKFELNFKDTI